MPKENQRVRLTKRLLKDTLIELLKDKRIDRITVTELCAASEINRSTFYQYYEDQYALLGELETDLINQTDEFVSMINSDWDSLSYLVELLKYIKDNRDIFSLLLSQNSDVYFQKKIMKSVLTCVQEKDFAVKETALSPYVYQFLFMGNLSIIQQWITNGFDITPQKTAALIFRLSSDASKSLNDLK